MNTSNSQVRRATLDDLVELRRLWQQTGVGTAGLEKRVTEFQVVETPEGMVLGAIGLQVLDKHGRIHRETFGHPELAEELRPRLWERLLTVSRARGLVWLWVENEDAMFWLEQGFELAGSEQLSRLPAAFQEHPGRQWLFLKLREEPTGLSDAEIQFELFRASQKEASTRTQQRAQVLKVLATLLAVLVFGGLALVGWLAWRFLHASRR